MLYGITTYLVLSSLGEKISVPSVFVFFAEPCPDASLGPLSPITTLSPEQKLIYKDAYSNELQQKRIKAIKKGRVGWVIGGFSCMAFLAMIFG